MLDIAGAIFVAGYVGSILMVVLFRAKSVGALKSTFAALLLWIALEAAIATGVSFIPSPVPPNVLMFALSVLLFASVWAFAPAVRQVVVATRITSLLALHAWRLGGFLFLLLLAAGRLPTPFAPVAAVGDMITGGVAAYLAIGLARGRRISVQAVGAWNAFGLLDLLTAVSLALLSTPGAPFQLFGDVPSQSAFASLPWMLVPAAIVPALMFVHLAIALKLRNEHSYITNNCPSGAIL